MVYSLENQMQYLISARNSEDQVDWTIFGLFSAVTAILLVAAFSNGTFPEQPIGVTIISSVGFGLSFVWSIIQARGISWIEYYEEIIEELEKELQIPSKFSISTRINEATYSKHLGKGIKVRTLMKVTPRIISGLWLIATFIFGIIVFLNAN